MIELYDNLYVGATEDYEFILDDVSGSLTDLYALVLAAKSLHKRVAYCEATGEIGYTGNMDKSEPEYLIALRDDPAPILALNLIDIDNPAFIPDDSIKAALRFIQQHLEDNRRVMIVDTKGVSMAPAICMLYLMRSWVYDADMDFYKCINKVRSKVPNFEPKFGILEYARTYYGLLKGQIAASGRICPL